jgi:hypothetical protein
MEAYTNILETEFNLKDPTRTAQETHSASVIKTSHLMLYRETIFVCSEIHTKYINKKFVRNVELLKFQLVVHKITHVI